VESWDNLLICWAWPQKHNQRAEETNEVAFIEFLFPISNCYTRSLHSHSNSYMLRNDMPKEVGNCEIKQLLHTFKTVAVKKWLVATDLFKIYSSYEAGLHRREYDLSIISNCIQISLDLFSFFVSKAMRYNIICLSCFSALLSFFVFCSLPGLPGLVANYSFKMAASKVEFL